MKKLVLASVIVALLFGACSPGDSEPESHEVMAEYMLSDLDADKVADYCQRLRVFETTVREANPKGATMLQLRERLEAIQQSNSTEAARLRLKITPDVDLEKVYESMMRGFSALCA